MAELGFVQRLAANEVPRRILGAAITPFAPGAGHVILGYPRIGLSLMGIFLGVIALMVAGALAIVPPLFLFGFAIFLLLMVASVVSLFALPPGPALRQGMRALWPIFVIVIVMRAVIVLTPRYLVGPVPVPDDSLKPEVCKDDYMLVHPGPGAELGDVVLVGAENASHFVRYDAALKANDVHGRALFVVKAGQQPSVGRIWKSLRK